MRAKSTPGSDGLGLYFFCPGCKRKHYISVKPDERGWDFNGDYDRPTFAPSILVYSAQHMGDDDKPYTTAQCHSFVREGRIEYLSDSTHALAGQTVELPELAVDPENSSP